jgi:CRP-like cAMP-binding protein
MLDSQQLTSELSGLSVEFRELIKSLDSRLRQVTDMVIDIQSNSAEIANFVKDKKPIIKQGQDEERLFKVKDGVAHIARKTDDGHVPLVRLKKGDFFGNILFLDMGHEPHSAGVFASPQLKLAAVDLQELQSEFDNLSSTLKNIFQHLATCISVTTLVAGDYKKKAV